MIIGEYMYSWRNRERQTPILSVTKVLHHVTELRRLTVPFDNADKTLYQLNNIENFFGLKLLKWGTNKNL